MLVQSSTTNRALVLASLLAFILFGLSLVYLTRHNLTRQKKEIERHMTLAASSIAGGIEGNLRMGFRRGQGVLQPDFRDMLSEMIEEGDLVFLELMTLDGHTLVSFNEPDRHLTRNQIEVLQAQGQWHQVIEMNGVETLVFAKIARPSLARMWSMHHRVHRSTSKGPLVLFFGMDMSDHLTVYNDFQRTALWQAFFILFSFSLLLVIGVAYLKRQDQARKLGQMEDFQTQLLDNLPDGILILSQDGIVIGSNPAALTFVGRGEEQVIGKKWTDICSGFTSKKQEGMFVTENLPLHWIQCALNDLHLEVLSLPLVYSDQTKDERIILIRNRTELKNLEDDLQEARRMASIGQLAAGLAHEIRNPLSALRGFAQYFSKKMAGSSPEEDYARTMVREADRLNKVITDLLSLARPKLMDVETIDLKTMADELRNLLRLDLDYNNVELLTDFSEFYFQGDRDTCKQALLNLLLNSLESMVQGGTITLSSRSVDGGVLIAIEDSGPGIPQKMREQVLEPFVTTKARGTGLGLSIVKKIMLDHQGRLAIVDPKVHQGSRVELFFPSRKEESNPS